MRGIQRRKTRSQMLILSARWAKQHETSPAPSEGRTERPRTARRVAPLPGLLTSSFSALTHQRDGQSWQPGALGFHWHRRPSSTASWLSLHCLLLWYYSGWEEIRPPRLVWNSGGEWLCLSGIDFGFIRITRSWLDVLVPFQKGSSDLSLETVHPVRGVCATREGTTHRQLRVSTWLQKGGSVESGQLRWFSGVGGRRASLLGGL